MNWLDYAILAIIGVSVLISLWRGFVREVLSIVVWVAAFWLGIRFAAPMSAHLSAYIASPSLQVGAAFAIIFIAVLVVGGLLNFVAGQLVGRTGLTGTDRTVGMVFGAARGLVIVALLVLLAGLTPVPRERWWQDSLLAVKIQPWVCRVGVDEWLSGFTVYTPLVSEAAGSRGRPAPDYWTEFCAAAPAASLTAR